MGIRVSTSNLQLKESFDMNTVQSDGSGMDMWMWREKTDFSGTIVMSELTWLILAGLLMLGYVCIDKFYTVKFTDHTSESGHTNASATTVSLYTMVYQHLHTDIYLGWNWSHGGEKYTFQFSFRTCNMFRSEHWRIPSS